jgi:hypothetical protein
MRHSILKGYVFLAIHTITMPEEQEKPPDTRDDTIPPRSDSSDNAQLEKDNTVNGENEENSQPPVLEGWRLRLLTVGCVSPSESQMQNNNS